MDTRYMKFGGNDREKNELECIFRDFPKGTFKGITPQGRFQVIRKGGKIVMGNTAFIEDPFKGKGFLYRPSKVELHIPKGSDDISHKEFTVEFTYKGEEYQFLR